VSDDFEALRRLRPDRARTEDPNDPRVLADQKERLMTSIDERTVWETAHFPAIYPRLSYRDERAAIDFLERAFGFRELREARMGEGDPDWGILAWLVHGDGVVMIGRVEHEVHDISSPSETGSFTCMLNVAVDDIDAHCERARAAGARITMEPEDAFYGYRRYEALDIEGHKWHFNEPLSRVRQRRGEPEPTD